MRYLVMRKEGLRHGHQSTGIDSSYFPVMVETYGDPTPEVIVRQALMQRGWLSYESVGKDYLVFRVTEAYEVSFRQAKPPIETFVKSY